MPSVQTTPLTGPGTFNQPVVPPTNAPVTVAASGQVNVALNSAGYIVVSVTDTISGNVVAAIADTIRPSEQASGVKTFNISATVFFAATTNLQVSVSSRALDGALSASAPAVTGASLAAFAANPVAVQGQI
jgi:hypothetical protein